MRRPGRIAGVLVALALIVSACSSASAASSSAGNTPGSSSPSNTPATTSEHWPAVKDDPKANAAAVAAAVATYRARGYHASDFFLDYTYDGSYMKFETYRKFTPGAKIAFDANGIPKVRYGEEYSYNPVTTAQFALTEYGKYLQGDPKAEPLFLQAMRVLLSLQDDLGAFRYNFTYLYYLSGETYPSGWVSAMAQGQALSAFARAYKLTGDRAYLQAGDKAYAFMMRSTASGGVRSDLSALDPSLKKYAFLDEYVSSPEGYTLNGYMFTLLGIYDWWQVNTVAKSANAAQFGQEFHTAVATLAKLLPYYDVGGFSSYDLGQYTYPDNKAVPHLMPEYHMVHIYLLHTLYGLTGNEVLQHYEKLWSADVA